MHEGIKHGDTLDDYSSEENYRPYVDRVIKKKLQELDQEICKLSLQLARARCRDEIAQTGEQFQPPLNLVHEIRLDIINTTMEDAWDDIEESHADK